MKNANMAAQVTAPDSTTWRQAAPILVLVLLAPVLAELLMGVVRLTNLWLLVPEMLVYGTAAVAIRYLARSRGRGWRTMLLLGIAFAIALETLILQTSLTPQFFPAGTNSFGWVNGVQWIYLFAIVGYEAVYAIVLPIKLTELIFPKRRNDLWFGRRGFYITLVIFLLSSVGVWLLWSRVGVTRYGPSTYQIPPFYYLIALLVIGVLVAGTLLLRIPARNAASKHRAWSPWLIGPIAFVFGLVWFVLIAFAFLDASKLGGLPVPAPLVFGVIWGALVILFISYQTKGRGWDDSRRFAVIFGAMLASMLGGVAVVVTAAPIDKLGKLVFDLIAVGLFLVLAWQVHRRHMLSPSQTTKKHAE